MKINVRILWVLAAALVSLFFTLNAPAASADTIVYSVTGVGTFAGTSFTVTTNAYLVPTFTVAPDPGATVVYKGTNEGTLTDVVGKPNEIDLVTSGGGTIVFACCGVQQYPTFPVTNYAINENQTAPNMMDTQVGEVTVTDTIVPTPEPGVAGLMLLGLGSLGLMMVIRKRIARGVPQAA